jgi:hypothetical protein
MRRTLFCTLGVLEIGVAAVLVFAAFQVPSGQEVAASFAKVERVTRRSGDQVRVFQRQVRLLNRAKLNHLAHDLKTQTRAVAALLRRQSLDLQTVKALRDVLAEVAGGFDRLAVDLEPSELRNLGKSLGKTAAFLEGTMIPTSLKAADQLNRAANRLRQDARRLSAALRLVPVDWKMVREVYRSLGQFSQGLGRISRALRFDRRSLVRQGIWGMESALSLGAAQVERLSEYTYPVLSFSGYRPHIEKRQFWPTGERIGEGMRKAARGVQAVGREFDAIVKELPRFRKAILASRKVVDHSRQTLATALKYRAEVEPLLNNMPQNAQRLADRLPQVAQDVSRVLRQTAHLKEIARGLQNVHRQIEKTAARWPEFRSVLTGSSRLLTTMRRQLDQALAERGEYQKAINRTALLAESFGSLLPPLTDHLTGQLTEEDQVLGDLGTGLEEVSRMVPAYGAMTARFLAVGRFLAWLVAAIVALHGIYLIWGTSGGYTCDSNSGEEKIVSRMVPNSMTRFRGGSAT